MLTATHRPTGTATSRFETLVEAWIKGRRSRRAYRTAMAELTALTPHDLADIGIDSSMFHEIALHEAEKAA